MQHPSPIPQWFSTLIREGLASLYTLCLEGCPAADILTATAEFWSRDLWNSPRRGWHEEADTPCIRLAFERMRQSCHRWPAPARFWELLPDRVLSDARALPSRVVSIEDRQRNIARMREITERLLSDKAEDAAS